MNQSVTITIDKMRCYAFHGVMPQERTVGTEYEVTLSIRYPAVQATLTDRLDQTVDYSILCDIIRHTMATPSKLIERVCGRIIEAVCSRFPQIEGGSVTVSKLNPPIAGVSMACASVTVQW